jgi:cell pole-organizing protein PopZ
MDEILALIRRIIAEDDTGKSAQRQAETRAAVGALLF